MQTQPEPEQQPEADSDQSRRGERRVFLWNVIASVVASVLVIAFVQPFLSLFWDALTGTGSNLLNGLVDRMYENASLGNRNWVAAVAATVALFLPINLIIVHIYIRMRRRRSAQRISRPSKIPYWLTAAFALIFMLVSATIPAAYVFTDLQLNASFDQRLTVLAPHITDMQTKQLRARWAQMKSRADYRSIRVQMEGYATVANIRLPEPLLSE